jgi:hypothetical protein
MSASRGTTKNALISGSAEVSFCLVAKLGRGVTIDVAARAILGDEVVKRIL